MKEYVLLKLMCVHVCMRAHMGMHTRKHNCQGITYGQRSKDNFED